MPSKPKPRRTAPPRQGLATTDEVCAYLNVCRETLYRWRRRNYGPRAIKAGRAWRWDWAEVERWQQQAAA